MNTIKGIHILLVEDNEGDILLTTEALEERRIVNKLTVLRNGEEAISFLLRRGKYKDAIHPDLVLLDVNLPKVSGHEVLQEIKSNQLTCRIPVIMLTTSSSRQDIDLSYRHHANCYITKPVDVDQFLAAVGKIQEFWLNIVTLPNVSD